MLSFLKVTNFALIDKLELDLKSGFNVLTGETGAGKSIIIKAVELLLGSRVDKETIRQGAEQAEISAVFTLNDNLKKLLGQHNLDISDNQLIVRRVLSNNGAKNFINGTPVTGQLLKEIMTQVVSICGQHDYQLLTSDEEQLKLVDDFGDFQLELSQLKVLFSQLKENKKQTDELLKNADIKEQRLDYLTYQLKEILEVNPQPEEESELQAKEQKILGMKDLAEMCRLAEDTLYGEEKSIISATEILLRKIKQSLKHDSELSEDVEKLEEVLNNLEAVGQNLAVYLKRNNLDDEDLDFVINRLESFKKLKRKYGGSIEGVLQKKQELENEKEILENSEQEMARLNKERKRIQGEYQNLSAKIHQARVKIASQISKKVTEELQELKMEGSEFKIQVNQLTALTSKGQDQIMFMISPNRGEGLKPLSKIASGGELSRIMLALTKVITEKIPLSLYIFDEIDAGIGGETGLVVGKKLQQIATHQQTICITHLPQVAVFADQHFVISKKEENKRTTSKVHPLTARAEVEEEVARMLGGNMAKNHGLSHAQAMIQQAARKK